MPRLLAGNFSSAEGIRIARSNALPIRITVEFVGQLLVHLVRESLSAHLRKKMRIAVSVSFIKRFWKKKYKKISAVGYIMFVKRNRTEPHDYDFEKALKTFSAIS
ncbi:MAG TPA: hypothetical protein VL122_08620 [Nitrospirota bacterium]|nr:hypothetical protein [Nitrospirota bacterium]